MFNPRGTMYEEDGYPSGGLLRVYKNFKDWAELQQKGFGTALPRGVHWMRLTWCPHCLVWRATATCGVLGMVFTILMLMNMGKPRTVQAKAQEKKIEPTPAALEVVPANNAFEPKWQDYPITETQALPAFAPTQPSVPFTPAMANDFAMPMYRPTIQVTFDRLKEVDNSWWPRVMNVSSLNLAADSIPESSVTLPYVPGWFTTEPGKQTRSIASLNLYEVTPYSTQFGVILTSSQLVDSVRAADTAPAMATTYSSRPVGFEVTNRWPLEVKPGKAALCEVIVRNTSGQHIDQVRIHQSVQPFERVTSTSPPAGIIAGELVWDESDWPAGEQRVYTITAVSDGRKLTGVTAVEVLNSLSVASTVSGTPRPTTPSLNVPRETQPAWPTTDYLPPDETPIAPAVQQPVAPQPQIPETRWPSETITRTQPRPTELEVLPVDPFPATPPRQPAIPSTTTLRLQMSLPPAKVGEVATIQFKITNLGQIASKNTRLLVTLPKSLRHPHGRDLVLTVGQIAPGRSYQTVLYADVIGDGNLDVVASTDADNAKREKADATMSFNRPVSANSRPEDNGRGLASIGWR